MKVQRSESIEPHEVQMEGASGCSVRQLVGASDGAPNFAMRKFEVEPGGHSPRHHHAYEHEVYILSGEGLVFEGDTPHPLKAGDVVFVKPDEVHQFKNTGDAPLQFLCLIPNSATTQSVTAVPECNATPPSS